MAKEIERKFLVKGDSYKRLATAILFRQGYLSRQKERVVRVRVVGDKGYLTIKGENRGAERDEFEYAIPIADAHQLLDQLCERPLIEKYRYTIPWGKHIWEVDEFLGENLGLVLAEIELKAVEEQFDKPDWIGQEVTGDPRYYNTNLTQHPFSQWKDEVI